jgi:hypothetical protein
MVTKEIEELIFYYETIVNDKWMEVMQQEIDLIFKKSYMGSS